MSDELYHWSEEPLGELMPVEQDSREGTTWTFIDKPRGLWVSVGDEWEEWCQREKFHLYRLTSKHRITLKPSHRLLWLKTAPEVLQFQEEYRVPILHSQYPGINWTRVASDWGAIIIAPYQWSLRLELMWYYGWDCASGCIWDPSIIERVELLSEEKS